MLEERLSALMMKLKAPQRHLWWLLTRPRRSHAIVSSASFYKGVMCFAARVSIHGKGKVDFERQNEIAGVTLGCRLSFA